MTEIKIDINSCDNCPHAKVSKVYTPDSFDNIRSIHCNLLNKKVYSYLDWNDYSPIPESCPAKA